MTQENMLVEGIKHGEKIWEVSLVIDRQRKKIYFPRTASEMFCQEEDYYLVDDINIGCLLCFTQEKGAGTIYDMLRDGIITSLKKRGFYRPDAWTFVAGGLIENPPGTSYFNPIANWNTHWFRAFGRLQIVFTD